MGPAPGAAGQVGSAAAASDVAEILVSDGMRVSPPEPSMLDMRNSILAADAADFGGALHDLVWDVFRKRGMGYFAARDRRRRHAAGRGLHRRRRTRTAPKGAVTGVVDRLRLRPADRRRAASASAATRRSPTFAEFLADDDRRERALHDHRRAGRAPTRSSRSSPSAGYDPEVARNVEITQDAHDRRATRRCARLGVARAAAPRSPQVSDDTGAAFGCGVDRRSTSPRARLVGVQPGQRRSRQPARRSADDDDQAAGRRSTSPRS